MLRYKLKEENKEGIARTQKQAQLHSWNMSTEGNNERKTAEHL